MSNFDPQSFLTATVTEALVKRPPLPADEYVAVVGQPTIRAAQGRKDPSKTYVFLDLPLTVEVPSELQGDAGYPATIRMQDSLILDYTEEGGLDLRQGKNTRLRLYREALDMNKPGQPFSIASMEGRPLKVRVTHEVYEGEPRERIGGVVRF